MSSIDTLTALFRDFPGIGPRQAKRFVYFLLSRDQSYLNTLAEQLTSIKREVKTCKECYRLFNGTTAAVCNICADKNRDPGVLLVVEKDTDLEAIEKSGAYRGRYFVFGGLIPLVDKHSHRQVRIRELVVTVERTKPKEIIFGFSVNADGENTVIAINQALLPLRERIAFRSTTFGRGLSTGSEVEYADGDTLKSALRNRI